MQRAADVMTTSLRFRAAIVSIALFLGFIGIWHIATRGTGAVGTMTTRASVSSSAIR
jgi:hypothetical protein